MRHNEKRLDQLKIIKSLDISPSMYKNATEKYQNLAKFLEKSGLKVNIYPQGSFALGTVTRPYSKDKERNYDLDFICQVEDTKENVKPKELRDSIENILKNSIYKEKMTVYDECFQITYADNGEIGFSIDIVPAVHESEDTKEELIKDAEFPELINTSIAIPRFSKLKIYNWITNNPKGYKEWFENINAPFNNYSMNEYRSKIFFENRDIYNTIEEVPQQLERSSLQIAIQFLKYHRDIYYSHITNGDEIKPISAFLTTIAAKVARNLDFKMNPFEILENVFQEIMLYEKIYEQGRKSFLESNIHARLIIDNDGKWLLKNPANSKDNLMDAWNENQEIPKMFFKWIRVAKSQLIDSVFLSDEEFRTASENAFGYKSVEKCWNKKYIHHEPKIISSSGAPKPWRK